MAARKKTPKKKAARKRAASTPGSESTAAMTARFQRESDVRSLQEAEVIRRDPARARAAAAEARRQQRDLAAIVRQAPKK